MAKSAIEWTDDTWNPISGCTRVSAGCDNCYAVKMTKRLEAMGKPKYARLVNIGKGHFNGTVRCHEDALTIPLKAKKSRRWFVNSMSDLFHRDVPFEFIDRVFAVMALCPQHTFQILTKRPERMAEYLAENRMIDGADPLPEALDELMKLGATVDGTPLADWLDAQEFLQFNAPLPNVWLGTSVEDQQTADERIPHLLRCPAAVRFLSCEPLLGPVDLSVYIGYHGTHDGGECGSVFISSGSSGLAGSGLSGSDMESSGTSRQPLELRSQDHCRSAKASRERSRNVSPNQVDGEREESERPGSSSCVDGGAWPDPAWDGDKPPQRKQEGQPPREFGDNDAERKCETRICDGVENATRGAQSECETDGCSSISDSVGLRRRAGDPEATCGSTQREPQDSLQDRAGGPQGQAGRADGGLHGSSSDFQRLPGPERARTISQVIVGGESGPGARPMHPQWARSLRDQCVAASVPFFFKQWGEWGPIGDAYSTLPTGRSVEACEWTSGLDGPEIELRQTLSQAQCTRLACANDTDIDVVKVGKKKAGRLLDGRTWDEFPVGCQE